MTKKSVVLDSTFITYQDTDTLRRVFSNIDAYSCPYNYNFHMHTICSDGKLTPLDLLQQAMDIGLKGFAITDHHSVDGFKQANDFLEQIKVKNPYALLPHLWTGVEITANLNNTEVHILGYGFNPNHSLLLPYLNGVRPLGEAASAETIIKILHQAGALVVLAHPARYRRSSVELICEAYELGIDGVEVYYSYDNSNPWQSSPNPMIKVKQMAEKYNLLQTCGTDTHGTNLLVKI